MSQIAWKMARFIADSLWSLVTYEWLCKSTNFNHWNKNCQHPRSFFFFSFYFWAAPFWEPSSSGFVRSDFPSSSVIRVRLLMENCNLDQQFSQRSPEWCCKLDCKTNPTCKSVGWKTACLWLAFKWSCNVACTFPASTKWNSAVCLIIDSQGPLQWTIIYTSCTKVNVPCDIK